MSIRFILTFITALSAAVFTSAQTFFNLTAQQVRIDGDLPYFTYMHSLGKDYADSVYSVSIEYPEFIDMSDTDIRRYKSMTRDTLPDMPEIYSDLVVAKKVGSLCISFVPLVFREGKYQKLVSFKLAVKARPVAGVSSDGRRQMFRGSVLQGGDGVPAARKPSVAERYPSESVLRSGRWVKISVPHSGVYQLTDELIRRAGFKDLSKVKIYGYGGALQPEVLTDAYLRSVKDLPEVPVCIAGGKYLFYARGPVSWDSSNNRVRNPYSNNGYYFLTSDDAGPLTIDKEEFLTELKYAAENHNTLYEVDNYAWFAGGRNLYDSRLYKMGVDNDYIVPAAAEGSGRLRVVLTSDLRSEAEVSINDSVVGTIRISNPPNTKYDRAEVATGLFVVRNLKASNKITVTQTSGSNMRLDYITLYSSESAPLPDLEGGTFPSPSYVYGITNQNHHADTNVDMVIVVPTTQKLMPQAERLKALHEKHDNMTVRIVPLDELYNEFSSGTPDATAIRRYMKMLYDRASTEDEMPKYLVMFGDGAWDNRMLSPAWRGYSPDDFLPCFESENSFSATDCYVADDFFCLLDDGERIENTTGGSNRFFGQPDIAVGRFPVRTPEDARIMVDKVEAYMNNDDAGAWQNTVVFLADDGNYNIHMRQAEGVAQMVEKKYPTLDVKRIMWDAYTRESSSTGKTYPEVTKLARQYMGNGALVMNYSGHGVEYAISHEMVLKLADFRDIKSKRLPLWVTAACDILPFDGQTENIGEAAVLNPSGGAVAFYGTTRTVYSSENEKMNYEFMKNVFSSRNGKRISIGEAVRLAKDTLVSSYVPKDPLDTLKRDKTANKLQFTLLGDPALVLAAPTMKAVVDTISGIATDSGKEILLKAGTKVAVAGRVLDNGMKADDFNGLVTVNVRGVRQLIVCKHNDAGEEESSSTPFSYYDRQNIVFSGTDSIRGGSFRFEFVVPKDITYNDGAGQINIYAVNADRIKTASGVDNSFILNGTGEIGNDSIGPSIYCYLNTSSFCNGSVVNPTPYFMAEISDEDGINVSGGSIGHDMLLVIDGKLASTFVLNDYFTFDFGSYTSGNVGFRLPQLSDGPHRLLFRAWDVLNNSSSVELDFNVSSKAETEIMNVECTDNPATTHTSFLIVQDRIGEEVAATIEVFDMSGRPVWKHTGTVVPERNTIRVDWDLTVGGGSRLGTGVYLYRATIENGGSSHTSKAKKLIVLSNK